MFFFLANTSECLIYLRIVTVFCFQFFICAMENNHLWLKCLVRFRALKKYTLIFFGGSCSLEVSVIRLAYS